MAPLVSPPPKPVTMVQKKTSSDIQASDVNLTSPKASTDTTPYTGSSSSTKKHNTTPGGKYNNYAAPHTPIASAKRPRQPASGTKSSFGTPSTIGHSGHGTGGPNSLSKLNDIHEHDDYDESQFNNDVSLLSPVGKMKQLESNGNSPADDNDPSFHSPVRANKVDEHSAYSTNRLLSPMHPAKPLTKHNLIAQDSNEHTEPVKSKFKTLNKIFSPVLNFLSSSSSSKSNLEEPTFDESDYNPTVITDDLNQNEDSDVYMEEQEEEEDYKVYVEEVDHDENHHSQIVAQEEEEEDDDDDGDEFNPYFFIKHLPAYHHVVSDPTLKIHLPPKDPYDPPISLVLDLDETLVHCTIEPIPDADMTFPVFFNGIQYTVHVRTRPYLTEFLEAVSRRFEVVVFTASQKVYANELLDRIDPDGRYIKHRMFRESCLLVEGNYIKDLNVLGRDLSTAVLVDNSPHAFGYQVDNGIPIESWFDDPHDTELLKLEQFLSTLEGVDDVRVMVRSKFQTYKLIRDA